MSSPASGGDNSAPKDKSKLSDKERGWLVGLGAVLVLVGLVLWIFPAKHQEAAPASAKCTDAKTCWVEVEDAPDVLLSSFVVLGALFVLIGINGRRLIKFAGPGVSFETEGAKAAEEAAKQTGVAAEIPDNEKGVASSVAAEKARSAGIAKAALKQAPLSTNEVEAIAADAVAATVKQLGL